MGLFSPIYNDETSVWRVSELTGYIRQLFELDYRLQDIDVTGEVSNFTQAASGHLYFTMKDGAAQIKCVMWRTQAERSRFRPSDGDAVIAHGRISVYEAGGVYQLYVDHLQPAGRGDLAVAFERLKEKLADEGLFDPAHKQPIPAFPSKIGIVTSADGAALRDVLTVLQRRNPFVSVLIAPTLVQGETAPPQIVRALKWLDDRDDIDVIILARGGGSIEDLWAFNDERVARAIYQAKRPIISGIGHETDFTIADFVADLRAPTPSVAAELAVPDLGGIEPLLIESVNQMRMSVHAQIERHRETIRLRHQMLWFFSPRRLLDNDRQQLDILYDRLLRSLNSRIVRLENRLVVAERELNAVSPAGTLARGFAIVRDTEGNIIRSVVGVHRGLPLSVQLADGEFEVEVTS